MNQSKVKLVMTIGVMIILGLYLGIGAASAQGDALKVLGVGIFIAIIVGFGKQIWLLVPLTMFTSLSFRWLPGNWRATEAAFMITIFGFALLVLSRKIKLILRYRFIHSFVVLVVLSVAQTYIRNPVGLAILGSSSVGARAYFTFGVSLMICVIFSVLRVPWRELFTMRKFAMIGGVFSVVAQWAAYIPGLGLPLALALGTGLNAIGTEGGGASIGSGTTRNTAGANMAKVFSQMTVSYVNPMRSFLFNRWTLIVLLALFGSLVSGFRSQVALALLVLGVGVIYWQGFGAFVAAVTSGVFALMCLAMFNLMFPLNGTIQRSLSFLPGTWEERYVRDGSDSTDWRVEMWKEALTSERWIKNKMIGDGLGFTRKELSIQTAVKENRMSIGSVGKLTPQQVGFLINGNYHSGPISFVRTTGYIGLAIFTLGILAVAISAHRLLRSLKGTSYFGVAAIVCISSIIHPIKFFLINGNFSTDIGVFFLNAGFLCFFRNNIDWNNLSCLSEEELAEAATQRRILEQS